MTPPRPTAVIVLAAGEGTRMKSAMPKVLHTIGGRSLVHHAIAAARGIDPIHLEVVVRHERDLVAAHIAECDPDCLIADQDEIKGTGRAVECGLAALPAELTGTIVVTYGDVPLLTSETLREVLAAHEGASVAVTVVTSHIPDPTGYGRIVRDADGSVARIVEQKDATDDERAITEVNSGIYAFEATLLTQALAGLGTDNAQGEKYLTDVVGIARAQGRAVAAYVLADVWQTEGVNDKIQLARLGAELNRRTVEAAMREGAIIRDPATTWIDTDVSIGRDTVIEPNVQLRGATTIGADCLIGPDTTLVDMEVGDGATVCRTQGSLSVVGPGATVGPWAYLRPGTELGAEAKIGTFVETKNANIGAGSKIPHLSYVGDATIGTGTNIGASSVFVNFDGVSKHRTTVGDHCRMGSDTMYVAPVTIGDGAYSGAGTVIRSDVPPGALVLTDAPQRVIEGWVAEHRPDTEAARAAAAAGAAAASERHTGDNEQETQR
ncbi:MAG TPA: bifunctional UDP-N-acetylglucosamine diphosphorylase/glucosamine-1-phosphate N-acetyltransferase GlmU [Dermatophilaceae bacterium]|nr:bifunctional UDP-N-acetylglucosamine diphosphorylase/glucosamine-1-phosphate N-acetyltransferase GlmU [Dermatophilaceae bacterium]HPK90480.1 bifunctional UDP-N-acetylglucosamine diphosphorylase/glucosamine-1-phosphate N-acetyltransferase GlmU [Dermatophilaceae bacterium]HQG12380.1 bifunctional UDP-N-acetylglucosamine diphosphorylase/glucosamine-1-phosphate N-acetyltransferase GlmU [Dermatophilaceae bacterium]